MSVHKTILAILVLICVVKANAQTNIGGVINTYTKITSISNGCSCPTTNCATVTVSSAAGFAANDIVLLIQMKGAKADSSNTITHGNILYLYDAGNYEFDTINSIAGNVITMRLPLKNTYYTNSTIADSAYVQLIKVPVYSGDVNVTSTLMPQAWSSVSGTGGVLAFWLTGALTLQANISANGLGFTGANKVQCNLACFLDTAFYYQSTNWNHASCTSCGYSYDDSPTRTTGQAAGGPCGSPCTTRNWLYSGDRQSAANRGEGIVANTFKKTFANGNVALYNKGKGKWGNGGGGGGNHNAGGGGGGGYGAGGYGGKMYNNSTTPCPTINFDSRRGNPGASLTPTATKVFMGGGGGEGHDNGLNGTTGVAGGGIIMIKAATVTNGGSYTITANGATQTSVAAGDGAGAGGAGGSILMDVSGSYTNAVTIQARGGAGGNHNNNNCHGTGGGGGGGVIWFSTTGGSTPANVTTSITGGANGVQVAGSIDCGDVNWGATAGSAGSVMTGLASGATDFLNINNCSSAMPIELSSYRVDAVDKKVAAHWTTASEINNEYFSLERSEDGMQFTEVVRISGAGNSSEIRNYNTTDEHPLFGTSYYRLSQTDFDGTSTHSQTVSINIDRTPELSVYPNPVDNYFVVSFEGVKSFSIQMTGFSQSFLYESNNIKGQTKIDVTDFPKGIYFLKAYSGKTMTVKKLVIM